MIMSSGRNVLVLGSGAREDCLTWKLEQSPLVKSLWVTPGNASTVKQSMKASSKVVHLKPEDCGDVVDYCVQNDISMVVVGPEASLACGIADDLNKKGISCFGPSQRAAEIESNKKFAKDFMTNYEIPTARYEVFTDVYRACGFINNEAEYEALVVKANGLAAGKGVVVSNNKLDACNAVTHLLESYPDVNGVVVEELLEGQEYSFLAFTDGYTVKMMPPAQDHKRLLDGDHGPNTGGMGAYCPCPQITAETMSYVKTNILQKTVDGMRSEGRKFVGVLYAGVMDCTYSGIKVLEFNCRFGDPECEAILPLLKTDLFLIMEACVAGKLDTIDVQWEESQSCVTLIMASMGYPGRYPKNIPIKGIEEVTKIHPNIKVFEAGTTFDSSTSSTLTSGGRVLAVSCIASQLEEAQRILMEIVSAERLVWFESAVFRSDIAQRGIDYIRSYMKPLSYADSGVDIAEGNHLVSDIKSIVKKSKLSDGCVGDIGGFGCCFDLRAAGYDHPILVSGTDGVGTKLMIAHSMESHVTIGIDLVAMCVNDILTHNAQPLYFLDYYACSKLDRSVAADVVRGIATGCELAGCSLVGGETAEMPGMYHPGSYDLAGFAVGAYDRYKHRALPCVDDVTPGDVIVGLSSSGLHSNGFSLVRKVVEKCHASYDHWLDGVRLGDILLKPTRIYVRSLLPLLRGDHGNGVRALAHITGGGLAENLPRVLPDQCGVQLDASLWSVPTIFAWLSAKGNIAEDEMLRTFNCGIGMCLIVDKNCADDVIDQLSSSQEDMWAGRIGVATSRDADSVVKVKNFAQSLSKCSWEKLTNNSVATKAKQQEQREEIKRKKIAVLISGSGTNLQSIMEYSRKTQHYDVKLVISNKETAFGLERAEKFGIETKVVNHKNFETRQEFEQEVDKYLDDVDVVVLAGFMRILSVFTSKPVTVNGQWVTGENFAADGTFNEKWRGRMVNIHPSLLPSFKGRNVHQQVLDAGVMITGCTVHFVIEGVDEGAVIAQQSVPVFPSDDISKLEERVKNAEHDVFPRAIELVASGKIRLMSHQNKVEWN